jgi:hypothetical protein
MVGVEVDDGRQGDAKQEVIGCAACQFAAVEVGHALKVRLVEQERVEPVDVAFVTGKC